MALIEEADIAGNLRGTHPSCQQPFSAHQTDLRQILMHRQAGHLLKGAHKIEFT